MDPRSSFFAAVAASAVAGFAASLLASRNAALALLAVVTIAAIATAALGMTMLAISMGVQSDDLRRRALAILAGAAGALGVWLAYPVTELLLAGR